MRKSFFLLAGVFCVAHEALAGPFVSASMGVSSVGYRGRTVRGQFATQILDSLILAKRQHTAW